MIIREFEKTDRELFISLCKDFYESDATLRPFDEKIACKTFDRICDHHENLWGLMLVDAEKQLPAGYALITSYWCNEEGGDVLVLDELYIVSTSRHKGYASQFMEWLENKYRDNAVAITLEVLTSNVNACGLYLKEGYQPDGFTTYTKSIKKGTDLHKENQ